MTDLRPIDPAPFAGSAGGDLGPVPMLAWLPIEQLRVDPSYQRELTAEGRRTIKTIVKGFDWCKFAPVVVAAIEGGLYAIIDRQHRTTAAAARGASQVPCLIVIADRARQAEAFAAINGQVTKVSPMAIYHARVAAGDPQALAVAEVCAAAEVTVLRSNQTATKLKRGETVAPQTLFAAYERHGRDQLITALQCVTMTSEGNAGLLNRPVIDALCTVLCSTPEWSGAGGALLDAMDDFDFARHLSEARVAYHQTGGSVVGALCTRLTEFLSARIPLSSGGADA